jgi:hypothetical protein
MSNCLIRGMFRMFRLFRLFSFQTGTSFGLRWQRLMERQITRFVSDLRGLLFPADIGEISQKTAELMRCFFLNHRVHRGFYKVHKKFF